MKTLLAFTMIVLISAMGNFASAQQQETKTIKGITKIEIQYVDASVRTPIDIDCDRFSFKDILQIKTVTNPALINRIMNSIMKAPLDTTSDGFDTRRRLLIYWKGGTTEPICIGRGNIQRKGKRYDYTKEAMEAIESLLPEKSRMEF